jgi:hypothetical protein
MCGRHSILPFLTGSLMSPRTTPNARVDAETDSSTPWPTRRTRVTRTARSVAVAASRR